MNEAAKPNQALERTMPLFGAAVFLGAFLVFLVQPIMGRFILPWFGGGNAVWTTCMLFFQFALLGGYAYAHLLTRKASLRTQAGVHLALLAIALCLLPITPPDTWKPGPDSSPVSRILLTLTATVGLPFVLLAATAPLLQSWFAAAGHGRSTYRLYAWSNAGSIAALACYPFLVEPHLTRAAQAGAWSVLLGVFVVCCAVVAIRPFRNGPGATAETNSDGGASSETSEEPQVRGGPAAWLTLSTLGSALLLGVTNKICQDVASMPFLWLLPLALYLASFVVVFRNSRAYQRVIFVPGYFLSLLALAAALYLRDVLVFSLHLWICCFALFFGCMAFHGELARLRPETSRLTAFYLAISAGGAAGGVLVSLLAPMLLDRFYELQITLVLGAGALMWLIRCDPDSRLNHGAYRVNWAWLAAVLMVAILAYQQEASYTRRNAIHVTRNFYGSLMALEKWTKDPLKHALVMQHGNIVHGLQHMHPALRREPTAYFGRTSGGGLALRESEDIGNRRIGVIGLGAGTLAAYGREGDTMRFYELDPAVIAAAREHFTYLSDSAAEIEIVPGDARLSLEAEPAQDYDLLVLDAFSSDAIPTHLLTLEAFELYLSHLKADGVIALHLSNRHLKLPLVVWAAAYDLGVATALIEDRPERARTSVSEADADRTPYPRVGPSNWMLMTRNTAFLEREAIKTNTVQFAVMPGRVRTWTDDYTALWPLLR